MSSSYTALPARQVFQASSAVLDSYNLDFVGDDPDRMFTRNILLGVSELAKAAMTISDTAAVQVSSRDFRRFSDTYFKQAEQVLEKQPRSVALPPGFVEL